MRGQRKNPRKAVQPFENKKRKIDIFKNYEANGVEKIQRKLEIFSTLISKKSIDIVGKGCCEVQYTDGMLSISQARDDLQACDRWLTIIGKGLRPQTGSTTIRKSRCL